LFFTKYLESTAYAPLQARIPRKIFITKILQVKNLRALDLAADS
jgi:hypothetical protein